MQEMLASGTERIVLLGLGCKQLPLRNQIHWLSVALHEYLANV